MTTAVHNGFEWDTDKAAANVAKHGVTFEEAATVFASTNPLEGPDLIDASRTVTVGFSAQARVLLVVSTEAGNRARIISARRATPAERRAFGER